MQRRNRMTASSRCEFRMRGHIFLRLLCHLSFALVSEHPGGIRQGYPKSSRNFDTHRGGNLIDTARAISHEIKADDLEYACSIAPGTRIDILDVRELRD